MKEFDMNTTIDFKFRGGKKRVTLRDMYQPEMHGDEEDFYAFVTAWLKSGRATIVDERTIEQKEADKIAEELISVAKAKAIQEDRHVRETCNDDTYGVYSKVGFPAKSLMHAQELHQMMMKNFYLKAHQLGVEMQGTNIIVTVTDCPAKTFLKLERALGIRRATEFVAEGVDKGAKSVIDTTDMAVNNLVVPVAKTTISATTKIAKSLFGLGAKVAGIAVGEIAKSSKQCVAELKTDAYLAEAKGEVIEGYHSVRSAIANKTTGGHGGIIMDR